MKDLSNVTQGLLCHFSVTEDTSGGGAPETTESALPPADCEEEPNPYDSDR